MHASRMQVALQDWLDSESAYRLAVTRQVRFTVAGFHANFGGSLVMILLPLKRCDMRILLKPRRIVTRQTEAVERYTYAQQQYEQYEAEYQDAAQVNEQRDCR